MGSPTLLAGAGSRAACLRIDWWRAGAVRLRHPQPARRTRAHAAFYSDTRRPPGPLPHHRRGRHPRLSATAGPFFHCHALWTHEDGTVGCGHVLPDETMIAAPAARHTASALTGARFEVASRRRNRVLPVHAPSRPAPRRGKGPGQGLALRLAPNQDLIHHAGRRRPQRRAISRAAIHGGVASIIKDPGSTTHHRSRTTPRSCWCWDGVIQRPPRMPRPAKEVRHRHRRLAEATSTPGSSGPQAITPCS